MKNLQDQVHSSIVERRALITNQINDSFSNDLEKGMKGEGSKGGKVIGHTTSGKPIYAKSIHKDHREFNSQDHKDAAKVHKELESSEEDESVKRKHREDKAHHETMSAVKSKNTNNPHNTSLNKGDELEKGLVSDAAFNSGNGMTFPKTGREIQGNLVTILEQLYLQEESLKQQLDLLLIEIGKQPTEDNYCYRAKDLNLIIPYKRFSWSECSSCKGELISNDNSTQILQVEQVSEEDKASQETLSKKCSLYNETLDKYCDTLVECNITTTILENIDEDQSYNLNITQLKSLGF